MKTLKNVYLFQPSNILSKEIFLPYAAGTLASYAWQFDDIKNNYFLQKIFFKKDPIASAIELIESPSFCGFSCYMWNVEYNLAFAKEIKARWPKCLIGFGGPQVPDDVGYLSKYPFIDVLFHGEGEQSFYRVLSALSSNRSLSVIDNISYREGERIIKTTRRLNRDITGFPSPYGSGIFDNIINDPANSGFHFDAVLETNRGCPYGCIYCYWAGTEKNFRLFSMDRIKSDLDWIAKNKIVYCICADSNFGILDRDQEITDYLVALKKQYGYPRKFETSSAKNKDEDVFIINKKLQSVGLNCGISVAVQSFSKEVLNNIGRANISLDSFALQMKKYRKEGISTYTDFILALPGETYDSFCHGLFTAIENGQHDSINVHPCEVLPNTILYLPETRKKYAIETIKSTHYQDHSLYAERDNYGSLSEIIVSTSTMSRSDWRNAMRLAVCVQSFHSFGLVKFIAVYLRRAANVSYYDFYTQLYEWIGSESVVIRKILDHVCLSIDSFLAGESSLYYYNEEFSDACLQYKEALFLCSIRQMDAFYWEISGFVRRFFEDDSQFLDLMEYQKSIIKRLSSKKESKEFSYDWVDFFSDMYASTKKKPLKKKTVLSFSACMEHVIQDYILNNIWYGKRENKMLRSVSYI